MQRLEVSGAVRPIYGSLGVKRLMSRIMAVRVLMVSERSYRNITLILTAIITSDPTLMTLFDRSSFLL